MINEILLIDDDEATNRLNSLIIKKLGCTKRIVVKERGQSALNYLSEKGGLDKDAPDLILLDLNMPGMNGWEFLEAYEKLPIAQKAKAVVVMLTTSLNPDDEQKAQHSKVLHSFQNKPLTVKKLKEMLLSNFPNISWGF